MFLIFGIIVSAAFPSKALANNLNLYVDGEKVEADASPIIVDGRTMVPVSFMTEHLGCTVSWDTKNKQILFEKDGKDVLLTLDTGTALIDGSEVFLDTPATIENYRVMAPLRFIAETFGANIIFKNGEIHVYNRVILPATQPPLGAIVNMS
ncbi:MAG: copper amine oxidase N-terminal domain-containing protein [Clostridiales bacterium]|nr:copper amine oxidase N-terminal domain-containing protein [Clostridiales bacterium]